MTSTDTRPPEEGVKFMTKLPPRTARVGLLAMRLSHIVVAGLTLIIAFKLVMLQHFVIAALLCAVVLPLVAPIAGIVGYRRAINLAKRARTHVVGRFDFRMVAHLQGFTSERDTAEGEDFGKALGRGETLGIPFKNGVVGVYHDLDDGSMALTVECSAVDFLQRSIRNQHLANQKWQSLLAKVHRGKIETLQWTVCSSPASIAQFAQFRRTHYNNAYVPQDVWASQLRSAAVTYAQSNDVRVMFTIRVVRSGFFQSLIDVGLKKAIFESGGGRLGTARVLIDELQKLLPELKGMGFESPHPLTPEEHRRERRLTLEPFRSDELGEDALLEQMAIAAGKPIKRKGWVEQYAYPSSVQTLKGRGYVKAGNSFHRPTWVSAWPEDMVPPDFLSRILCGPGVACNISFVIKPLRGYVSSRGTGMLVTWQQTSLNKKRKKGIRITPDDERRAAEQTEQEKAQSRGEPPFDWSLYYDPVGSSQDHLTDSAATVDAWVAQMGCQKQVLYSDPAEALTYFLGLGRGRP